jgi:hypothetical protein
MPVQAVSHSTDTDIPHTPHAFVTDKNPDCGALMVKREVFFITPRLQGESSAASVPARWTL